MDDTRYTEDECGVPQFRDPSPFTKELRALKQADAAPPCTSEAFIHVFDDLVLARSVAVSIYGTNWRPYVLGVYEALLKQRTIFQKEGESNG